MPPTKPIKRQRGAPLRAFVKTEGQRRLLALKLTLAEIAAAAGVTKNPASRWQRGIDLPTSAARERLEAVLGVPAIAWSRLPTTSRQPQALPSAPADNDEGVAAEVETLTMAQALEADLAFAAELELADQHDVAAKLLANCLIHYAELS